jgi:hypothetical protein
MSPQASSASTAGAVQIKRGGKIFDGSFTFAGGTVTVAYLDRTKKARLGRSAPEVVARKLLAELVAASPPPRKVRNKLPPPSFD